ncbi:hypothetical protein [Streptomyces albogriseolus]|uniref:hypothetical protein n=1 Tax=Streptomyces albogriseolus TaxID=1887 RepID=UPI00345FFF5F
MQVHEAISVDREVEYTMEIEAIDRRGRSAGIVHTATVHGRHVMAELKALQANGFRIEQPRQGHVLARCQDAEVSFMAEVLRPQVGNLVLVQCGECACNHEGEVTEVDGQARTFVIAAEGAPGGAHRNAWTDIISISQA